MGFCHIHGRRDQGLRYFNNVKSAGKLSAEL
jgi:hypothetical protein